MWIKIINFLKRIFGIHSPSKEWMNIPYEYHEEDTKCDLCPRKNECDLIEITIVQDTRKHYINNLWYACPLNKED